eukprot:m.33503 g.33503  ORF g.33503 m.33503 type:complete len:1462 (+) comp14238_c0_seq4:293-4678(+)
MASESLSSLPASRGEVCPQCGSPDVCHCYDGVARRVCAKDCKNIPEFSKRKCQMPACVNSTRFRCDICEGMKKYRTCNSCGNPACLDCSEPPAELLEVFPWANPNFNLQDLKAATLNADSMPFYTCALCETVTCEKCCITASVHDKWPMEVCARCHQTFCDECIKLHPFPLAKCGSCRRVFCEDCMLDTVVVCYQSDCTCEPPCICSMTCLDCRDTHCRTCTRSLTRHEAAMLRGKRRSWQRSRLRAGYGDYIITGDFDVGYSSKMYKAIDIERSTSGIDQEQYHTLLHTVLNRGGLREEPPCGSTGPDGGSSKRTKSAPTSMSTAMTAAHSSSSGSKKKDPGGKPLTANEQLSRRTELGLRHMRLRATEMQQKSQATEGAASLPPSSTHPPPLTATSPGSTSTEASGKTVPGTKTSTAARAPPSGASGMHLGSNTKSAMAATANTTARHAPPQARPHLLPQNSRGETLAELQRRARAEAEMRALQAAAELLADEAQATQQTGSASKSTGGKKKKKKKGKKKTARAAAATGEDKPDVDDDDDVDDDVIPDPSAFLKAAKNAAQGETQGIARKQDRGAKSTSVSASTKSTSRSTGSAAERSGSKSAKGVQKDAPKEKAKQDHKPTAPPRDTPAAPPPSTAKGAPTPTTDPPKVRTSEQDRERIISQLDNAVKFATIDHISTLQDTIDVANNVEDVNTHSAQKVLKRLIRARELHEELSSAIGGGNITTIKAILVKAKEMPSRIVKLVESLLQTAESLVEASTPSRVEMVAPPPADNDKAANASKAPSKPEPLRRVERSTADFTTTAAHKPSQAKPAPPVPAPSAPPHSQSKQTHPVASSASFAARAAPGPQWPPRQPPPPLLQGTVKHTERTSRKQDRRREYTDHRPPSARLAAIVRGYSNAASGGTPAHVHAGTMPPVARSVPATGHAAHATRAASTATRAQPPPLLSGVAVHQGTSTVSAYASASVPLGFTAPPDSLDARPGAAPHAAGGDGTAGGRAPSATVPLGGLDRAFHPGPLDRPTTHLEPGSSRSSGGWSTPTRDHARSQAEETTAKALPSQLPSMRPAPPHAVATSVAPGHHPRGAHGSTPTVDAAELYQRGGLSGLFDDSMTAARERPGSDLFRGMHPVGRSGGLGSRTGGDVFDTSGLPGVGGGELAEPLFGGALHAMPSPHRPAASPSTVAHGGIGGGSVETIGGLRANGGSSGMYANSGGGVIGRAPGLSASTTAGGHGGSLPAAHAGPIGSAFAHSSTPGNLFSDGSGAGGLASSSGRGAWPSALGAPVDIPVKPVHEFIDGRPASGAIPGRSSAHGAYRAGRDSGLGAENTAAMGSAALSGLPSTSTAPPMASLWDPPVRSGSGAANASVGAGHRGPDVKASAASPWSVDDDMARLWDAGGGGLENSEFSAPAPAMDATDVFGLSEGPGHVGAPTALPVSRAATTSASSTPFSLFAPLSPGSKRNMW